MISGLAAGANTVLATALFNGQAALSAVADPAILQNPDEAANFATAVGVFAFHVPNNTIPPVYTHLDGATSNWPFEEVLLERARSLAASVARFKTNPDVRGLSQFAGGFDYEIRVVRELLMDIQPVLYNGIAAAALNSGLAVFGHGPVQSPQTSRVPAAPEQQDVA